MNKPREFWIVENRITGLRIVDKEDKPYPNDKLKMHVREVTPQDEKYKKALEEIAETVHDGETWPTDSHIKAINIALVALGRVEHSEPEGTSTSDGRVTERNQQEVDG